MPWIMRYRCEKKSDTDLYDWSVDAWVCTLGHLLCYVHQLPLVHRAPCDKNVLLLERYSNTTTSTFIFLNTYTFLSILYMLLYKGNTHRCIISTSIYLSLTHPTTMNYTTRKFIHYIPTPPPRIRNISDLALPNHPIFAVNASPTDYSTSEI